MLPQGLRGEVFFRVKEAKAAGLTAHQLRGSHLSTPLRGVRCMTTPDTWSRQRAVLAIVAGGAALSHVTAAAVHRLPLPPHLEADSAIHVMLPAKAPRLRRQGIVEHRGIESRRVILADGLPVSCLSDTWADLADVLSEPDLIAVGDEIARRGGLPALRAVVDARTARHARHCRRLARALARVRADSRSRMESIARIAFVDAGLPEPDLNASVKDAQGEWLATVDFYWPQARLVVEYQSEEHHATPGQRSKDEDRRRMLQANGYQVLFITAATVLQPSKRAQLMSLLGGYLGITPR